WLGGGIDRLPAVFLQELQRQWNDYLRKKYGTTENLKRAWKVKEEPLGREMLKNADFSQELQGWVLEQHGGTRAVPELTSDVPPSFLGRSLRIRVEKGSDIRWYVQFHQPALKVEAGRPYTISFWAKADKEREITLGVSQAHEPWENLGFAVSLNLGREWQYFSYTFQLREGDPDARLCFSSLAQEGATFWLAGISFRTGGVVGLRENEKLEDGSVPVFLRSRFGERTPEAQDEWLDFLWEKEDNYWQTMYRFLKKDLGVKAIVIGTIVGCSTPNIMSKLDCVDTHSYWQHPIFPSRPWDPEDWIVPNRTMVNERGGTLPGLALKRVLGKPHSVTEYNHPAPNTYSSEGFLLLSAYAGLQDWDAIYAFAYSHRRDEWDKRMIPNFFDIDQHPTKMVTLIPSVAMFVRGDIKPANKLVAVEIDKKKEIEVLKRSWAWHLVDAGFLGVPPEAALIHRVAIAVQGEKVPAGAISPNQLVVEGNRFASDTGELVWDISEQGRGLVTINTPRSKAVIGYAGGKTIELDGFIIEAKDTLQNGWCAITLTAMKGDMKGKGSASILITATGYAENTDMKWKNAEKSSVGRNWGRPPSLVEGIPARIVLPYPPGKVEVWALDEEGKRKEKMEVGKDEKGRAVLEIGPRWRTLWYEVEAK
ncbi:MAG: carbohydrate binding domain-containing protein, partial [bacterium]